MRGHSMHTRGYSTHGYSMHGYSMCGTTRDVYINNFHVTRKRDPRKHVTGIFIDFLWHHAWTRKEK